MEIKISDILSKSKSDKNTAHNYGRAYDEVFARFDRFKKLNILEIGTQSGASLLAWREFFPNAIITGIDIIDLVKDKNSTINYIVKDIKKFETEEFFDIVIDDGSHWLRDIVHTVDYFSRKLNPKGVMVIEDIQMYEVWFPTILNILSPQLSYNDGYEFGVGVFDARPVSGLTDDLLILIENKKNV